MNTDTERNKLHEAIPSVCMGPRRSLWQPAADRKGDNRPKADRPEDRAIREARFLQSGGAAGAEGLAGQAGEGAAEAGWRFRRDGGRATGLQPEVGVKEEMQRRSRSTRSRPSCSAKERPPQIQKFGQVTQFQDFRWPSWVSRMVSSIGLAQCGQTGWRMDSWARR